ncbi:hypothetical protein [Micropruina sp.]|uniref:hypothetical protein n=1 Tax=Micropruina sp. TaxID=2737536 RepID=UPI0039E2A095
MRIDDRIQTAKKCTLDDPIADARNVKHPMSAVRLGDLHLDKVIRGEGAAGEVIREVGDTSIGLRREPGDCGLDLTVVSIIGEHVLPGCRQRRCRQQPVEQCSRQCSPSPSGAMRSRRRGRMAVEQDISTPNCPSQRRLILGESYRGASRSQGRCERGVMAKQLPAGWVGSTTKEVLRGSFSSGWMTLWMLPSLISQILLLANETVPAWLVSTAIVTLLVATFGVMVYNSIAVRRREAVNLITNKISNDQLGIITGVVTMVSNVDAPHEKAFKSLVRNLSNVATVYAVICPGEESQIDQLEQWLTVAKPAVSVRRLHTEVDRHRPGDATVAKLAQELRLLPADGTIVDVTTDNSLCTITLLEAAKQAGVMPATFLASNSATSPWSDEFALVAIHDPAGMFEDSPVDVGQPA